jgi:hypothetical protein
MMQRNRLLQLLVLVAALTALPGVCAAVEERSLLTADGTLHVVRAGAAVDLGVQGAGISPQSSVIEWSSRSQDGTVSVAILPGSVSYQDKYGLELAYDDQTATLLLLWTEDVSAFSQIRVGALRAGTWTSSVLLPSAGISRAHNPQMLVTHRNTTYLDDQDNPVARTSSILSVIWWEESHYAQARYATLFLDETSFDPTALSIYDLPAMVGTGGDTSSQDIPSGAYLYPSLQADGLSGGLLASFADLHEGKHRVVHIDFPRDWGKPSEPDNVNWKRRHIPIVGVAMEGPIARMTPSLADRRDGVRTTIGTGYRPTLSWREGDTLKFSRLDGADWAPVRSIAIDDAMTYDRALALVTSMGERK